jgi:predicted O-methyltransferase YrrM
MTKTPTSVLKAKEVAFEKGFAHSCIDEVGQLLSVLSASVQGGVIGEIGTGYGVGTSWLISARQKDVSLITIDNDAEKIETVSEYIKGENIQVLRGDWKDLLAHGPFKLLFADGGQSKVDGADTLFESLEIRGMMILDDLTPIELWPKEWIGKKDPVRDYWLNHPKMRATEIRVSPNHAVILSVKTEK